ncbi:MAG TPA: class I SAM-dependent methyltransferase [Xanthobacteraceae bacterium]
MAHAPTGYKGMEGFVARWYARTTPRNNDECKRTARRIAAHLTSSSRVLEIAPGPGYLAIELVKLTGCRVTGLDISHTFVEIAAENVRRAGLCIDFQEGNAADLPFPAGQFDFIVCRAAFKNFARPLEVLNEMHRVLRPRGTALIVDLRKDFSREALRTYLRDRGMIDAAVTKFIFNTMLKKRAYTTEGLAQLVATSQFKRGDIRVELIGFELWLRK